MPELSIDLNGVHDRDKKNALLLNGYTRNQTHRVAATNFYNTDKSLGNTINL